jgi:hypothetical protein
MLDDRKKQIVTGGFKKKKGKSDACQPFVKRDVLRKGDTRSSHHEVRK